MNSSKSIQFDQLRCFPLFFVEHGSHTFRLCLPPSCPSRTNLSSFPTRSVTENPIRFQQTSDRQSGESKSRPVELLAAGSTCTVPTCSVANPVGVKSCCTLQERVRDVLSRSLNRVCATSPAGHWCLCPCLTSDARVMVSHVHQSCLGFSAVLETQYPPYVHDIAANCDGSATNTTWYLSHGCISHDCISQVMASLMLFCSCTPCACTAKYPCNHARPSASAASRGGSCSSDAAASAEARVAAPNVGHHAEHTARCAGITACLTWRHGCRDRTHCGCEMRKMCPHKVSTRYRLREKCSTCCAS